MKNIETFEIETPKKNENIRVKYKNAPQRRGLFSSKCPWSEMPDREIIANYPDYDIPDNSIATSQYNAFNFLPKNLIQQFSKSANFYFLIIGILQTIKEITISQGQPVIYLPLSVIVAVSVLKDLIEDYKRKRSDQTENNRPVRSVNKGKLETTRWQNIRIGNIVKIYNNEYFPCDLLLIGSSDSKGIAYIETKNLDGETNLKHKVVPKELRKVLRNERDV